MKKILFVLGLISIYGCSQDSTSTKSDVTKKYNGVFIPTELNGKYGYVDTAGNTLIDFKYDFANFFDRTGAVVKSGSSMQLIDRSGEVLSDDYDNIFPLSEGLYRVERSNKFGFIDSKGVEVITLEYSKACDFSEGLAYVYQGDLNGFIDVAGGEVLPLRYDTNYPYYAQQYISDGICRYEDDGKIGFISIEGKVVVDAKYEDATVMNNDRALVMSDLKYAVINSKGDTVVPFTYDYGLGYKAGVCPVRVDEDWFLIDKDGVRLFPDNFDLITFCRYNNNFIINKEGKWGVIDKHGEIVIEPEYQFIESLGESLYGLKQDGKWGAWNNGKSIILDFEYENVIRGSGNYFFALNTNSFTVSLEGKFITPTK